MPNIDLTDDELAALTAAARRALADDRYPNAPRFAPLKSALAKLDPGSAARAVEAKPPLRARFPLSYENRDRAVQLIHEATGDG